MMLMNSPDVLNKQFPLDSFLKPSGEDAGSKDNSIVIRNPGEKIHDKSASIDLNDTTLMNITQMSGNTQSVGDFSSQSMLKHF